MTKRCLAQGSVIPRTPPNTRLEGCAGRSRYTSVSASWTQPAGTSAAGATSTPPSGSGWTATPAARWSRPVARSTASGAPPSTTPGTRCTRVPPRTTPTRSTAGDHFTATVTYLSGEQFSLLHRRHHPGLEPHHRRESDLDPGPVLGRGHRRGPVLHASGDPAADRLRHDELHRLTANGSAIGNAGGLTEIVMIDNEGRDEDTVSSLTNGENFSATWLRISATFFVVNGRKRIPAS